MNGVAHDTENVYVYARKTRLVRKRIPKRPSSRPMGTKRVHTLETNVPTCTQEQMRSNEWKIRPPPLRPGQAGGSGFTTKETGGGGGGGPTHVKYFSARLYSRTADREMAARSWGPISKGQRPNVGGNGGVACGMECVGGARLAGRDELSGRTGGLA